jgi:serine/threonine-protein kinase
LPPDARFCLACGSALESGVTRTSAAPHPPASVHTPTSDSFDHGRFAPGTLIGERYRIVARLGVGGMGEVYRADDLTLGQAVALKFLPEAVERDAGRLDKFTAEVRTARQIAHPNVCRVYDVGEVPSTGSGQAARFLTMEYVDGEDLQSLLRRIGRFQEDKGLEIARQICAGLAAMHDRGVLHRDLKPANIMIDGRGRVRLTDFGLATAVAGAPSAGSGQAAPAEVEIAGTPAYMAPEQFAGQPLTPATDLYALGLVLYELFTGERVQQGKDVHAIRSAQHTVAQTLTTSGSGAKLDPLVQRVIERCLDPDPKRRPQSAVVIAAALPGGDPLAAALAAGETPSPQMVAAACSGCSSRNLDASCSISA